MYVQPFTITALDIHRDGIYMIKFFEIIVKNLSDQRFDYAQQQVNSLDFTLTISFNFYDIEYLLDESKVLELGNGSTNYSKDLTLCIKV